MEIASTVIEVPDIKSQIEIHHLTDAHIDSPDYAREELEARIAHIAETPLAYWVGGGDYWSLIMHNDPRFNASVHPDYRDYLATYPDRCLTRGEETFGPIADKCLGFALGNHEATVGKHYHRNLGAELCARLNIHSRYLGDRGWVILNVKNGTRKMTVKGYQYHGWSAGRLKGRKALHAERDVGAWRADFILLGHDHQPYHEVFYTEEPYCSAKRGWMLKQKPVAILNGGSWGFGQRQPSTEQEKKGWKVEDFPSQSWVEGKNFRPQPPVCPYLLLDIDFGYGAGPGVKGRPSSFGFDVRYPTPTFHFGE